MCPTTTTGANLMGSGRDGCDRCHWQEGDARVRAGVSEMIHCKSYLLRSVRKVVIDKVEYMYGVVPSRCI